MKSIIRKTTLSIAVATCLFAFLGCIYDIPITSKPTGEMDSRLLGQWASADAKIKLKVVKLNDENYIVVNTDGELYQAWRSDVVDVALLTVMHLETETPKYSYWNWELSDDGSLVLRIINHKIVPDDTIDSATVRKLLSDNLQNPALFGDAIHIAKGQ
jgi:hypothetical protein